MISDFATLIGPMTAPELLSTLRLNGHPVQLSGQLKGGKGAGIGGDWPSWQPGSGKITAIQVATSPELRRYIEVQGLTPSQINGREVWGTGSGGGDNWDIAAGPLMAAVARSVLTMQTKHSGAQIHTRLSRIAEIAAGRLRLATEINPAAHLPTPDPARVRILSRYEAYGRFFSVEEVSVQHRRYDGNWSEVLEREVFVSADAALLLPYDPINDHVLLVSQFRIGPMARGQAQCWMLEPVAGRIDAGETPEQAALREAQEEAGLFVDRLYPLPPHYPTPGANSEFFYPFIAIVRLDNHMSGAGFGLGTEGEDIATHIIPRHELIQLTEKGQIQCGPLITMALTLDRMIPQIRRDHDPQSENSGITSCR